MTVVRRFVARAGRVDAPVLVLGETGTGKSLLARVIHTDSVRARGPFVAVNCAAVPDSLFESELFGHRRGAFTGAHEDRVGLLEVAHRGTILLDEIGDLPAGQQAKLLTVLEEGEVRPVGARQPVRVDVRVVSATSCDLERGIETGTFRRDLFHRLALLAVRIPPLRERPEDVPPLAAHFLAAAAARHRLPCPRLDAAAVRLLTAHAWPGNVRELDHALEAALILDDGDAFTTALAAVLTARPTAGPPLGSTSLPDPTTRPRIVSAGSRYSFYGSAADERVHILATLDRCHGNRTQTARELRMSRNTLRDRMRRYGL
jgi:DNA-binding NtrC family response regulator